MQLRKITTLAFLFYSPRTTNRGRFNFRTKDRDGRVLTLPFGAEENTMHRVLQRAFREYTHLPCMGTRRYVKQHKPEGARFPLKVFAETNWKTFGEVR